MIHAAHAALAFLSNLSKFYMKTMTCMHTKAATLVNNRSVQYLILQVPNCSPILAAVKLCTAQQAGVLLDAGTSFPFIQSQLSLLFSSRTQAPSRYQTDA